MTRMTDPRAWGEFKRQARRESNLRGARRFGTEFYISRDPKLFRFFTGKYGATNEPVKRFNRVYVPGGGPRRRGGNVICNCQNGKVKVPCVPCYYIKHGAPIDGSNQTRDLNLRVAQAFAVNAIHLATYHITEVENKGRKYKRYHLCAEDGCEHCEQGKPTVFGRVGYAAFSRGRQFSEFTSFDDQISAKCDNCEDGEIVPVEAVCPHCDTPLSVKDSILRKLGTESYTCPHCHANDFMVVGTDCRIRDPRTKKYGEGCGDPRALSIFDVDVELRRDKQGDQNITKMLHWYKGELDDRLMSLAKADEFKFLDHQDPEDQAKFMNLPNPFFADGESRKERMGSSGGDTGGEEDNDTNSEGADDNFPF